MKLEILLSTVVFCSVLQYNVANLILHDSDDRDTPLITNFIPNINSRQDSSLKRRNSTEDVTNAESRQISGIHFYPGSPVYDSLLTRRTFIPSLRMILLELSLMTLSVFVMNAVENMMHAPKTVQRQPVRKPLPMKNRYKR